jgi:hypothetical protein
MVGWSPTPTRYGYAAGVIRGRGNQLAAKGTSAVERFNLGKVIQEGLIGGIDAIEVPDIVKSQRQRGIDPRDGDTVREIFFLAVGLEPHRVVSSDMLQGFYRYVHFQDRPNALQRRLRALCADLGEVN